MWHDPSPEVGTLHLITNLLGKVVLIGLTWAFFQHLFSGLRHFVLDTGAGYELKTNKLFATLVFVGSITATAAVWLYVFREALHG